LQNGLNSFEGSEKVIKKLADHVPKYPGALGFRGNRKQKQN